MANPSQSFIRLSDQDSVVTALKKIPAGSDVAGVKSTQNIPRGHKIAIAKIHRGEPVVKYGHTIGIAKAEIAPGEWVHDHNIEVRYKSGEYELPANGQGRHQPDKKKDMANLPVFDGFLRGPNRSGTRNYIGLVASVNCSASVVRFAAREIEASGALQDFPQVDGIVPITHGTGCGRARGTEGFEMLRRTVYGYATHPNFGAVAMVGLGCEDLQLGALKTDYNLKESETFRTYTIQSVGGTRKTVEAIKSAILEMLPICAQAERQPRPISEIKVALQCGGSDAYSGLTANPALGYASDILAQFGGTSILAETPEIYGAEHLLLERSADSKVSEKLIERIRWWEDYTRRTGGEMDSNPSPGNKAGGLSTILEKSLGAVAKGGKSPLNAVYEYAERVSAPGLVFMDSPGYDPVSVTGQVAGGANIVVFTTGRGSAFGSKPVPTIKLATNTEMFSKMQEDMDIDCGEITGTGSLAEKGTEIFDKILATASGGATKSEDLGYGDNEFVPWEVGPTM